TVAMALWHQGGVTALMLLVVLLEFRQARQPSWSTAVLQGLACGAMLPCRLSAGLFLACFGLWVLCRAPWRALVLPVIALAAYAPWLWLYSSMDYTQGHPVAFPRSVVTCWTS